MYGNAIIIVLLLAAVLSAVLGVYIRLRRKSLEAPSLAWLMLSVSIWSFAAAVELQLTSVPEQKIFNVIRYIGIVSVPVWLLYFSLEYSQMLQKAKRLMSWPVWIVPILTVLILATNDFHHLLYAKSIHVPSNSFLAYRAEHGLWWWIHMMYSYFLIVLAVGVLLRLLFQSSKHQKPTVWLILVSSIIPLVASILYASGYHPFANIDITPMAFTLSGLLFFWGLYSKRFFTVKPIALNTLFNNLPDGIIVTDFNRIIIDINNAAIEILGLEDKNPLNSSIDSILPYKFDFSRSGTLNKVHLIFHNGRHIEVVHSVIRNEHNDSVGYMVVIKDVTIRRQSEARLKAATERLELASKAAGLDAWENNVATGSRVGGIKVYLELGYTEDEVPKNMEGIYQLIHPEDLPSVMTSLKDHFQSKTPVYSKDFRIRDKQGNYQWVANYARVVERDANGNPLRFVGITQNINQRKQVEDKIRRQNEELLRVNAEKDKFFSIIAHDLRGPFQGFIGLTELMSGNNEIEAEDMKQMVQTLNATAKSLYELLENLLSWAMVKRGLKKFTPQKILLVSIIEGLSEIVSNLIKQKGLKLTNNISAKIYVLADNESLKTVFRNVVSNAIKFTPQGGTITLNAHPNEKGFIEVSVTDTGIGMPPQIKDNLFSISTKVSRQGTNNEPSTGLGLILCKELVEKHGGTIWVESHERQGTTIFFTIPLAN